MLHTRRMSFSSQSHRSTVRKREKGFSVPGFRSTGFSCRGAFADRQFGNERPASLIFQRRVEIRQHSGSILSRQRGHVQDQAGERDTAAEAFRVGRLPLINAFDQHEPVELLD